MTFSTGPTRRRPLVYAALAVAAATAVAALWVLGPRLAGPPRTLTLATGLEGGDYAALGPRYQKILARNGITVRLLPTGGDVENLAKLQDSTSDVSAAFVLAGIATDAQKLGLASLGSVMYSPMWVFVRGEPKASGPGVLVGQRVSIGPEGGGTDFQARRLLALNGLDPKSLQLKDFTPAEAEKALGSDELDVLVLVASWESPVVQRLAANPRVSLVSFSRADAYVARDPYLTKLVLPMGVGDLAKNLPLTDVTLIASQPSLLIREDLNPALQYLLLEAASEIHGGPALFQRPGRFPAGEAMDVPLSADARHFYKSGPPFLYQYFPFWLAVLLERLLILFIPLVPLLGLLYPALRVAPQVYYGAMQRRVLALYKELRLVEAELDGGAKGEDLAHLAGRVEKVEARANRLRVPLQLSHNLYQLKAHILLVRGRVAENSVEVRHPTP